MRLLDKNDKVSGNNENGPIYFEYLDDSIILELQNALSNLE